MTKRLALSDVLSLIDAACNWRWLGILGRIIIVLRKIPVITLAVDAGFGCCCFFWWCWNCYSYAVTPRCIFCVDQHRVSVVIIISPNLCSRTFHRAFQLSSDESCLGYNNSSTAKMNKFSSNDSKDLSKTVKVGIALYLIWVISYIYWCVHGRAVPISLFAIIYRYRI